MSLKEICPFCQREATVIAGATLKQDSEGHLTFACLDCRAKEAQLKRGVKP